MQSIVERKTSLKLKEHHFKWTINNWKTSFFMKSIISETFTVPDLNGMLDVRASVVDDAILIGVKLCDLEKLDKRNIEAYILINNQKIKIEGLAKIDRSGNETIHKKDQLKDIVVFTSSETYQSSDKLVIIFEVKYGLNSFEDSVPYDKKMVLYDFSKLFIDKKFCDVVFLTNGEQLSSHIAVLAAASPYFFAMFDNPITIENQKRVVDFSNDKDVTAKNLQGFLEYIYGAKSISELSDIVSEILILADKFRVEQLRKTCECYMSESIAEENVVDILILSDKNHCELLKSKALGFAKMHIDAVKASNKFNELLKIADMIRNLLKSIHSDGINLMLYHLSRYKNT